VKERKVINLSRAIAVAALMAPISAMSLGIGDFQLHSALNQKLQAEIRLHLAPGESASDVTVRLAAPEKFDQAGVPWNYFLSKINFTTLVLNNGTVLIKVSSKDILTEPFLNFLLEVDTPQGSTYREFTVLVDPPSEYDTPIASSARTERAASQAYNSSALDEQLAARAQQTSRRAARKSAVEASAPTAAPAAAHRSEAPVVTNGT
jgi:pilus assembly protein FimV